MAAFLYDYNSKLADVYLELRERIVLKTPSPVHFVSSVLAY